MNVTFPTIDFPHRGEFERAEFVSRQETAQDKLADDLMVALDEFQTQATALETNVTTKEASVVNKHDVVVAKEALMNPHYANIDICAENIGTIGSKIGQVDIHNSTSKTTPVDADELAILDSASSFGLKKLTWANLKATLFGSPTFTGTPTAPTAPVGTNTTQIATTAGVRAEIPNMLNASGTAPIYACRAWVNFNGTGTVAIRASGNVSSITDNGPGNYTINFIFAMPDANFKTDCIHSTFGPGQPFGSVVNNDNNRTISSVNVKSIYNNAILDVFDINVSIFR